MKPRLSTIVVSLAALTSPAAGFLPGVGSDSFFPNLLLNIVAPRTVSHADQTKIGILAFLEQRYGIDNPQYGFEPGFFRDKLPRSVKVARNLIVDANEGVDGNKHGFREKDYGPAHFDDEYFEEGQNHLMMLRSQMIQMIQTGFQTYFFDTNVNQARIFL